MKSVEIAIVGGGLSGLYLAYLLEQQGISYQLIEAKPYLGGRILSKPVSGSSGIHIDLGPTWFWPHQSRIQRLIQQLSLSFFEQYVDGDVLYQQSEHHRPRRMNGTSPLTAYRLHGGMNQLIKALAETIPSEKIWLSHPVTDIKKEGGAWRLSSMLSGQVDLSKKQQNDSQAEVPIATQRSSKTVFAKKLVITLPPRVLLRTLSLEPWLPSELLHSFASTSTWMAGQAKFAATYATPFWQHQGLSGQAFSQVGPLVEVNDASVNSHGVYSLFGFLGMPAMIRQKLSADEIKQLCLRQLASLFGEQALLPENIYFKDWAADPYVTTERDLHESPAHPELSLTLFKERLAEQNLAFAGTEYASEEAGYLEGALLSVDSVYSSL